MSPSPFGPPQLGEDDVVRFVSAEHFREEYDQNLKLGRLFVRCKRALTAQARLRVLIQGPGVSSTVRLEGTVLLAKSGFVGLEIADFDRDLKNALQDLAAEVEGADQIPSRGFNQVPEEVTLIGGPPHLSRDGSATGGGAQGSVPFEGDTPSTPSTSDSHLSFRARPDIPAARTLRTARSLAPPSAPPPGRRAGLPTLQLRRSESPPESELILSPPPGPAPLVDKDADPTTNIPLVVPSTEMTGPSSDDLEAGPHRAASSQRSSVRLREEPEEEPQDADEAAAEESDGEDDEAARLSYAQPAEGSDDIVSSPPRLPEPRDDSRADADPLEEAARALEDPSLHVPRATTSGVLRATDLADLLGIYLCSVRHGLLTVVGGPPGNIGEEVTLKLASKRVVTLSATVRARVGPWLTLELADPEEIRRLLAEHSSEWMPALQTIAPEVATAAVHPELPTDAPGPPPKPGAVVAIAPPAPSPSVAPPEAPVPRPSVLPSLTAIPAASRGAVAPAPAAPPAPPPAVEGPPEPPRLEHGKLVFRSARDLNHEILTNLKNGGLFAVSNPLPIRSAHTLGIVLGGVDLGLTLQADVVFAAGGRVGFSVGGYGEVVAALERALAGGVPSSARPSQSFQPIGASHPPSGAPGLGASLPPSTSIPPPQLATASIPAQPEGLRSVPPQLAGKIRHPPTKAELIRLQQQERDLDQVSTVSLIDYFVRGRARGVLLLKEGRESKTIYFHEGGIAFVEARPPIEEQCLGRILISMKKLNELGLRDGLERARSQKKPLGRTLVSMGSISGNALLTALREQTRMKIEAALDWKNGTYEWGPWQEPPTRADLVSTNGLGLLCKHIRQVFDHTTVNEIEELLQGIMSRVVILSDDLDVQSTVFGLQPKELRFIEMSVDGKRNLGEMLPGSPLGRLASLRLFAFGLSTGFLAFKDGSRPVSHGRAPRAATDHTGMKALKRRLEEDLRLLKDQNYFEILGVHWSAHYRTYPAAYAKAKARFDNKRGELKDAPQELQELGKKAVALIDQAYKVLTNEGERINYRKQFFDATEREYSADMLVKQGEVMALRGDRVGCLEAFETAVELAPTVRNKQLLAAIREGKPL